MNKIIAEKYLCVCAIIAFTLGGCIGAPQTRETQATTSQTDTVNQRDGLATLVLRDDILVSNPLDSIQHARMTPEIILDSLMRGNADFVSDRLTIRNTSHHVRNESYKQYPVAIILSCMDLRLPVEDIFHRGLGDLMVLNIAGNVVDTDILGSMEYGCKYAGAKLIMVLGHNNCGTIKSAIEDVREGNITPLLSKIRPAVSQINKDFHGENISTNPAYVEEVCRQNVLNNIENIRKSVFLRESEESGGLKIIGAVYNMETGKVTIL